MAVNISIEDIRAFLNSKEGRLILGFIIGKSDKQIKEYLAKQAALINAGEATTKGTLKSLGWKALALCAALYIARQEGTRAWSEATKMMSKDELTGFQKLGRAALELWPPTMTVRSFKAAWDWLTTAQRKNVAKQQSPEMIKAKEQSEKALYGISDEQLADKSQRARSATDAKAEELGMMKRPANPTAQTEWAKEVERMYKTKKGGNHPTWYGKYPEYLTSNLQYGVRKEAGDFPIAIGSKVAVALVIPQKATVASQAYRDAINAIYVKLRGSNSGAFNYDPEDVASYIELTRSIRGLHATLCRDIKLVNNVDPYVSQTPDAIIRLAGYDATGIADLKANRANYINELNQMAAAINATMPAFPDMAVYDRTDFVATSIVEEGKGPKSSVFMYGIDTVMGWDSDNKIKSVAVASNLFYTRLGFLRTLIDGFSSYSNPSYGGPTLVRIAGDMLKAYGNSAFRTLPLVDINQKAQVMYDEYLLHQLQNLAITIDYNNYALTTVASTAFSLKFTTTIAVAGSNSHTIPIKKINGIIDGNGEAADILINTNKNNITGLESISLSRSVAVFKFSGLALTYGIGGSATLSDCGSDTLSIATYYYTPGTQVIQREIMMSRGKSTLPLTMLTLWAQVDYSPNLQIFDDSANNGDNTPLFDLDTYAYMSVSQFRVFNDTATLSLYKTVNIQDQVNFKAVKSSK